MSTKDLNLSSNIYGLAIYKFGLGFFAAWFAYSAFVAKAFLLATGLTGMALFFASLAWVVVKDGQLIYWRAFRSVTLDAAEVRQVRFFPGGIASLRLSRWLFPWGLLFVVCDLERHVIRQSVTNYYGRQGKANNLWSSSSTANCVIVLVAGFVLGFLVAGRTLDILRESENPPFVSASPLLFWLNLITTAAGIIGGSLLGYRHRERGGWKIFFFVGLIAGSWARVLMM